jgi:polyphosphate glucokinase
VTSPKRTVLAIDIGGTHVKAKLSTGDEKRRFDSGPTLTPQQMADGVHKLTEDWSWDVVSIGIPTPIRDGKPMREPINLGDGWVAFDYEAAFGTPTKVVNDAVMQALGSYEGGRMLFLGLGAGLGSTMIIDGTIAPMELGHLPFKKKTFEDYVSVKTLPDVGKKRWKRAVFETVELLVAALEPEYVVLGGGGVKELDELPPLARRGDNENAFVGGFRLWD